MATFGVDSDYFCFYKADQKQSQSTPWVTMQLLKDKKGVILYFHESVLAAAILFYSSELYFLTEE